MRAPDTSEAFRASGRSLVTDVPEVSVPDLTALPLYAIADVIAHNWQPVGFGAVPYLNAMRALDSISQNYGYDTGHSVVAYFLANAGQWRGSTARQVKAELRRRLSQA